MYVKVRETNASFMDLCNGTMTVNIVRALTSRIFVVRRMDNPAVFCVEYPNTPTYFRACLAAGCGSTSGSFTTSICVGRYDCKRKAFHVTET